MTRQAYGCIFPRMAPGLRVRDRDVGAHGTKAIQPVDVPDAPVVDDQRTGRRRHQLREALPCFRFYAPRMHVRLLLRSRHPARAAVIGRVRRRICEFLELEVLPKGDTEVHIQLLMAGVAETAGRFAARVP